MTRFRTPWVEYGALTVLVLGVMFVGLYPQPLFDAVDTSTATIFGDQLSAVSDQR